MFFLTKNTTLCHKMSMWIYRFDKVWTTVLRVYCYVIGQIYQTDSRDHRRWWWTMPNMNCNGQIKYLAKDDSTLHPLNYYYLDNNFTLKNTWHKIPHSNTVNHKMWLFSLTIFNTTQYSATKDSVWPAKNLRSSEKN